MIVQSSEESVWKVVGVLMDKTYKSIGLRIRNYRKKQHMTQDELADRSGLSNSQISNIENGWTKVSLDAFLRIANALGASSDELLCDNLSQSHGVFAAELSEEMRDCSANELKFISDVVRCLKRYTRSEIDS